MMEIKLVLDRIFTRKYTPSVSESDIMTLLAKNFNLNIDKMKMNAEKLLESKKDQYKMQLKKKIPVFYEKIEKEIVEIETDLTVMSNVLKNKNWNSETNFPVHSERAKNYEINCFDFSNHYISIPGNIQNITAWKKIIQSLNYMKRVIPNLFCKVKETEQIVNTSISFENDIVKENDEKNFSSRFFSLFYWPLIIHQCTEKPNVIEMEKVFKIGKRKSKISRESFEKNCIKNEMCKLKKRSKLKIRDYLKKFNNV
ncbi:hypothetical protein A3Q56_06476 [Intoshia linei]|uniref:Uncharacterized protein n=1 Tax=Intoshia linei TaxID=1819745 RepID=A0A177AWM3_9BILA|nr:hypothetical protein A3Q56_06476 [Intoshia linei]